MPSVVFDVVGTCFSYDNGAEAVQTRLGHKLAKYGIPTKLLFYAWVCGTERDYSYLSQIKQYKPFFDILSSTLKRVLFQAGIPAEDLEDFFTAEDVEYIREEYKKLKPRPGLAEMMQTLRDGGFEVWCCSDANVDRVKGYFDKAGVPMPLDHILSADMVKAGKPEPAVYKFAREKAGSDKPGEVSVFAASHAWDIAAAKSAGFSTAYTTTYELDECVDIFGKADLVTPDLVTLGKGIVEKWGKKTA
ncbi:haloacid dehalogenase, type II [Kwoniella dejecticola CBS 10117]|uniref:Haloacid dehalogenase, type II n=1 Tax=Kwoniella dejecticola CBS 10117 TaxID=1296121 RepID=A0A1A6AC99_9TREE|nr:haloacid dehalogenase, type II [Kwoniella dejecticola CBS 10117]OBR87696.1 haloacid dehalogenase, type II [Kwoniella dejecticola CBS 10117]